MRDFSVSLATASACPLCLAGSSLYYLGSMYEPLTRSPSSTAFQRFASVCFEKDLLRCLPSAHQRTRYVTLPGVCSRRSRVAMAAWCWEAGTLGEQMRHSDPAVTLRTYSRSKASKSIHDTFG